MFFLLGGWGERSCPISAAAIHSMGVDRTPNYPIERRTLLPASYSDPVVWLPWPLYVFFSVSAVMSYFPLTRLLKNRCLHMIFKSPRLQAFCFVARCKFIECKANKQDNSGIRFWIAVDFETKYLWNGFPYEGKDESSGGEVSLPTDVVRKLMIFLFKIGYKANSDNYFTSLDLCSAAGEIRLQSVGTIRAIARKCQTYIYWVHCTKMSPLLRRSTQKANAKTYFFTTKLRSEPMFLTKMSRCYSVKAGSRLLPIRGFYN